MKLKFYIRQQDKNYREKQYITLWILKSINRNFSFRICLDLVKMHFIIDSIVGLNFKPS